MPGHRFLLTPLCPQMTPTHVLADTCDPTNDTYTGAASHLCTPRWQQSFCSKLQLLYPVCYCCIMVPARDFPILWSMVLFTLIHADNILEVHPIDPSSINTYTGNAIIICLHFNLIYMVHCIPDQLLYSPLPCFLTVHYRFIMLYYFSQ